MSHKRILILFILLMTGVFGVQAQQFVSDIAEDGMVDDFEGGIGLSRDSTGNHIGFVPWNGVSTNITEIAELSIRQLIPESRLGIPDHGDVPNNVLAINYDILVAGGFSHNFTDGSNWVSQDWSAYNAIGFWLYGNNTRGTIFFDILDNRSPDFDFDTAERWSYRFRDDYSGWRHYTIPFEEFRRKPDSQPLNAPDDGLGLTEIWGYAFNFPWSTGPQTAYVDDVQLLVIDNTEEVIMRDAVDDTMRAEDFVLDESIGWDTREWELMWSDEFDAEAGTPINDEYWTCLEGNTGRNGQAGWGNLELQYYTPNTDNVAHDGDGNLVITAREAEEDLECYNGRCAYTSARCITQDKVEFTYGRVEARIKIPRGKGIWPAFWMLGSDFPVVPWPYAGEIDIMENIGQEPNTIHGTIHGPGYSGSAGLGGSISSSEPYADDFHVYAVDWDPFVIRWYLDGELYKTISVETVGEYREWVFDYDFFILMNIAVGGYWPGWEVSSIEFPQQMVLDYVRVYQLQED